MSRTTLARLCAALGIGSVVLLGIHSMILGARPAADAAARDVANYLHSHATAVLASAWLDGIGSIGVITVIYVLVHLTGHATGLWGRATCLVATTIIGLSLVIDAALIAAVHAAGQGGSETAATLWSLAAGLDFVFPVANAVWMSLLGMLLFRSSVLPRAYAPLVVLVGVVEITIGTAALFSPAFEPANNLVFIGFVAWMLAASIGLAVGAGRLASEPEPSFATT